MDGSVSSPAGLVSPRWKDEGASFAAYVAHELRTPLATQRALLELALADVDADGAAWQEIGEDVLDACRQQERLLDACLVLARSEGRLSWCEPVDLERIVDRLVRSRDVGGLTVRSSFKWAPTTGDPDLIERLVDNLLENAVRHNTAGGWIDLATGRLGTNAFVRVENSGPPIAADELKRLFEPFQQVAAAGVRPAGGLGLGLAVAKAVADAHEALITLHARPSGGLRVEIAFAGAS